MSGSPSLGFRKYIQFGRESTWGTEVNATHRLPIIRESLKAIVDKVAGGGLGALRPDELDRFRSNPALAGLLKEEAVANAMANGFEDILRKLGLDRRLAQEEATLKATIEQINQITINSDPAKLVEDLRKKLEPFFERVNREALEKLTKEFEKQVARARANLP